MTSSTTGSPIVLRGGTVFDGLGSPGVQHDVVLDDVTVAAIVPAGTATVPSGGRVIDCTGRYICPGFVDAHCHSDVVPLLDEPQPFKLLQGVTTEINGNCGAGFAPLSAAAVADRTSLLDAIAGDAEIEAGSFTEFLDRVAVAGPTNNVAYLVGHTPLRLTANGADAELRDGALDEMCDLAAEAFDAGAIGFSTGLIYPPGCYADADELHALAKVASRFGGVYATHMRNEGADVLDAIDEAVAIARAGGLRLQVSHCKVSGRRNHGRAGELLARLAEARLAGVDVHGDQYPYAASSTVLATLLPERAHVGGPSALVARLADPAQRAALRAAATTDGWSGIRPSDVLIVDHSDRAIVGRTLAELTEAASTDDAFDVLCDVVAADPAAAMILHAMSEDDVREIMASPLIGIGSDNGVPGSGLVHPRSYGTFPRVLGEYVREHGVLTWEAAIAKATSHTAQHFGLHGRGTLLPGSHADVVVFDPDTIGHAGTFTAPEADVTGVALVVLDGEPVIVDGQFTGDRRGRVLRRPGANAP